MDFSHSIGEIQFGVLSNKEIKNLSECEITAFTNSKTTENTPYDSRLGAIDNGTKCPTCQEGTLTCPGHFGHISLPICIYNRTFMKYIVALLQCVCHKCSRLRIKNAQISTFSTKVMYRDPFKILKTIEEKCSKYKECPHEDCGEPLHKVVFTKRDEIKILASPTKKIPLTADHVRTIFKKISDADLNVLGFNRQLKSDPQFTKTIRGEDTHLHKFRPENLIIKNLLVIPPSARPYAIRDGETCDDDITAGYDNIIKLCNKVSGKTTKKTKSSIQTPQIHRIELQNAIWTLMNSKDDASTSAGGRVTRGIVNRLIAKEGRVQNNIGGKRVDFSARSVIVGGGIMLKNDELGVPEGVASILTKDEVVGEWNYEQIRSLIKNKKINRIRRGHIIIRIEILQNPEKFQIKYGDIAERHLRDGDIVMFNRQPTLRVESMLAFKVKVVSGYSFRLGLAWTSGFNADFDGRLESLMY